MQVGCGVCLGVIYMSYTGLKKQKRKKKASKKEVIVGMASFDSPEGHSYGTTFDSFHYSHDLHHHLDHGFQHDHDHDHGFHHHLDLDNDRSQSPPPPLFMRSSGDGFDRFTNDDSSPLPPPAYHHSSHANLFDGLDAAEEVPEEEEEEEVARMPSSSLSRSFDASPQPFDVPPPDLDHSSISEADHGSFGQGRGSGIVDGGVFGFGESYVSSNGDHSSGAGASLLPPPEDMRVEEGFLLREWRRQNAIRLAEKERLEKEKLAQIIEVADRFKEDFYIKRSTHCETSKKNNREKEKVSLANQESFHKNADKHYWKAVGELVPHELPTAMNVNKSRGDKEKKKASTLVVVQGPKPGKPTDISRMRQILLKLKHNPPEHMKAPPPPPASSSTEKLVKSTAAANAPVVQTLAPQPVVAS